jgi:PKD repeat protein
MNFSMKKLFNTVISVLALCAILTMIPATVSADQGTQTSVAINAVIPASPPQAAFTGSPLSGNSPLAVRFTDQSAGQITSWSWNFGDGSTSGQQNITHTYTTPGTYSVNLTVTGSGGSDTLVKTNYITVTSPSIPVAAFTGSPLNGGDPLTVHFVDQSAGNITVWNWNFGDGSTSSQPNPTHTFQKPGLYTVSLTVSGPGGSDTLTRTDYVTVTKSVKKPVARFDPNLVIKKAPVKVQFTDRSLNNPTTYQWDFDDSTQSSLPNPEHTFTRPGFYSVRLTVSNSAGHDSAWGLVIAIPKSWWDL